MFWENFLLICAEKGTTPTQMVKMAGIAAGSVTSWKKGTIPRPPTIKKLADFLEVPVERLLGNEEGPTNEGEPKKGIIICRDGTKEIRHMTEEELAAFDAFYNTYIKKN